MNFIINDEFIVNQEEENNEKYFICYNPINEAMFVLNNTAHEIYTFIGTHSNMHEMIDALKKKYILSIDDIDKIHEIINFMRLKELIYEDLTDK